MPARKPFLKRLLALSAALLVSLPAAPALAWWETGHMITAQVAYDNLKPEIRAKADKLIAHLNNTEPDSARHHFVPVSVWMDETKARGLNAFNEWHYINLPYNPEGLPKVEDAKETSIVSVMDTMALTLKDPRSSDFEKAFALRILLHLFGDIHQPYHAVGKHSHEHPQGDLGGNRTLVVYPNMKNVHAFWDSTAGLFPEVKPPDWQGQIPGFSASLQKQHPRTAVANNLSFAPLAWAQESYKLAVKYGYEPLPADGTINQAYIDKARAICAERLALGGYRLAELLNGSL